ncbi:MAG: hypothetical protein MI749_09495 [Desulfovibrionales bacterium]|nr:hypothetical protein [Desulfovibrionales bacterium]
MANSLTLLDEALRIGGRELEALRSGDMDVAEEAAEERGRLIAEALEHRTGDIEGELRTKLVQMQGVQVQLTDELKKLHSSLKSQLLATRQKSARCKGYQQAFSGQRVSTVCLDKQG